MASEQHSHPQAAWSDRTMPAPKQGGHGGPQSGQMQGEMPASDAPETRRVSFRDWASI